MKRQRTDLPVVVRQTKRPIDKALIVVQHNLSSTQASTVLYTAISAVTFSGGVIRGSLVLANSTAATIAMSWALVLVPQGYTSNTLSVTDGQDMYDPEQNVLAGGSYRITLTANSDTSIMPINEKLKSMRKMKEGDQLFFISRSSAVPNSIVLGASVALFFKQ